MSDKCVKNPTAVEELFSAWDAPEDMTSRWECPDTRWQSSPSALTDLLAQVLQQYFSDPLNFTNDEVRALIQSQKPFVTQMTHIDPKNAGQLPKIAVEFTGSQQDERRFGRDNQIDYNIYNSTGTFFTVWRVQLRVDIIAKNKREAILLGESVCRLFNHHRTTVMQMLAAYDLVISQFQGAQVLGENAANGFQTSLGLTITAPDKWYLSEAAPRLKRISNSIYRE